MSAIIINIFLSLSSTWIKSNLKYSGRQTNFSILSKLVLISFITYIHLQQFLGKAAQNATLSYIVYLITTHESQCFSNFSYNWYNSNIKPIYYYSLLKKRYFNIGQPLIHRTNDIMI